MKIFLESASFGGVNTLRQTPFFSGSIASSFLSPIPGINYDYFYLPHPSLKFSWVKKRQRVWIMMENPAVWMPSLEFLEWYGYIVSPFVLPAGNYTHIQTHPAIPWFYGVNFRTDRGLQHVPDNQSCRSYNLIKASHPHKKKLISMITSSKGMTVGHQWRFALATKLKEILKDKIDIFGFGHRPISNKCDALDPYYYTVVVENSSHYDYWTEKLSDAMLARCMPIYFGAPNISDYFNKVLFQADHLGDVEKAALNVVRLLESSYNDVTLSSFKNSILNIHNLYSHLPSLLE